MAITVSVTKRCLLLLIKIIFQMYIQFQLQQSWIICYRNGWTIRCSRTVGNSKKSFGTFTGNCIGTKTKDQSLKQLKWLITVWFDSLKIGHCFFFPLFYINFFFWCFHHWKKVYKVVLNFLLNASGRKKIK